MGEMNNTYQILVENLKGRHLAEDSIDGETLDWNLEEQGKVRCPCA